ncbi:hypothetical protein Vretifemale_11143 [Volvox reticuliferus]|uniref:Uncharacterized protein n=1 Tax=Volvox reticuliferus TaxID=1737510 RepID=A0A8J4FNC0_9CHLO|nr:hypothetical protein Vretifemale_11143 [Volvox reticuliferus]
MCSSSSSSIWHVRQWFFSADYLEVAAGVCVWLWYRSETITSQHHQHRQFLLPHLYDIPPPSRPSIHPTKSGVAGSRSPPGRSAGGCMPATWRRSIGAGQLYCKTG